jgi:hypothetical protein
MPPKVAKKQANKGTEKAAENSKNAKADKKASIEALKSKCSACSLDMPNPATYKQHFENKHPKLPLPAELVK